MSVAVLTDLTKSYGAELILHGVSFRIESRDRIGLVGPNGAGKTTLLICSPDGCSRMLAVVSFAERVSVGYLPQVAEFTPHHTLFEEMLTVLDAMHGWERRDCTTSPRACPIPTCLPMKTPIKRRSTRYADLQERFEHAGGYTLEQRVRQVLDGLGFSREQQAAPGGAPERRPADTRRARQAAARSSRICCCWTSRRTTSTSPRWNGWRSICSTGRAR